MATSGPLPATITPVTRSRAMRLGSTNANGELGPRLKVTALNVIKTRNAVPSSSEPYSGQWSRCHQECFCIQHIFLIGCCTLLPRLDERRCSRAGQYMRMCIPSFQGFKAFLPSFLNDRRTQNA